MISKRDLLYYAWNTFLIGAGSLYLFKNRDYVIQKFSKIDDEFMDRINKWKIESGIKRVVQSPHIDDVEYDVDFINYRFYYTHMANLSPRADMEDITDRILTDNRDIYKKNKTGIYPYTILKTAQKRDLISKVSRKDINQLIDSVGQLPKRSGVVTRGVFGTGQSSDAHFSQYSFVDWKDYPFTEKRLLAEIRYLETLADIHAKGLSFAEMKMTSENYLNTHYAVRDYVIQTIANIRTPHVMKKVNSSDAELDFLGNRIKRLLDNPPERLQQRLDFTVRHNFANYIDEEHSKISEYVQ